MQDPHPGCKELIQFKGLSVQGHPDGARWKTTKSDLMNVINNHLETSETSALPPATGNTYVVDPMAFIITIYHVPITYSDLAKATFTQLPYGYFRIDIVADTYRENS